MKLRAPLQGLGIRARVVILALLPVVGAVTMIGYNLAASRLEDAERHLAERASLIARNLALASEFALFSNNETLLKDMLRGVATDTEVRWAAVWDRRRGTLVSHGQGPSDYQADRLFASLETEQPLPDGCYGAPIRAQALSIDDFGEQLLASPGASPRAATDVLGYAAIEVAPDRLVASRNAIVVNTTLIALGSILGSFLIALWLGNSITDPVMRLIKAVRELRGGKLGARVDVRAGGELGRLEEGVNGMAASLEHSQQVLRERVEQATAALRHTVAELEERNLELDEARRLALKAGAERTEFLARMSHEIRTPLNAIVGFTRLLQRGDDNVEHLGTIQRAAEQLLHVINDILQFIRLDADADQLEVVEFDVASVLEDAVSMLAPMANEKDLELVLLPHSDLPISVWSDPGRLSQVVVNLVNNAIKFTEQGHVVVEAKRTINEHGWHQVEVSVSDTGIGLTPAQQAQVFRAFAQSDSSITRRFGGTGLGLSIAERLVKLMHGEIGVESVKGRGSRFWFRIPCTDCAAAPPIEVGGPL